MAGFVAKWEFVSAENLENFMDASGVPENLRETAKQHHPSVEISQDGDKWVMKTIVSDNVKEVTFKIGEEIDTQNLIGVDIKATVTMEGNKMVEIQKMGDDEIKIVREHVGDTLITNMTAKGVTCVCKFKRA